MLDYFARCGLGIGIMLAVTGLVRPLIAGNSDRDAVMVFRDGTGMNKLVKAAEGPGMAFKFSVHLDREEIDKIREACR